MGDKIVLCRRDLGPVGEKVLCAKPITSPNTLDWCLECSKRLPIWPITQEEATVLLKVEDMAQ